MWVINFGICLVLYLYILYKWSRRRLDECLSLVLLGYFCCPVFKVGTIEVNGSYFITMILFLLCADYFQGGKFRASRNQFVLFQIGSICLTLMAGALNGVFDTRIIVPLTGHLNVALGTFGCAILFRRVNNPVLVLRQTIVKANVCHISFGVLQLTNTSFAYKIMSQLYATPGRNIPLDTMKEIGAFTRVFGATFSPTILGGYVLFAFSFVFSLVLIEKGKEKKDLLLLLSTVLLGFVAFSKTAIIGMPLVGSIFLIWILFHGGIRYGKLFGISICLLLIAFGIVALYAKHFGLLGQLQYYFGTILSNPLRAFRGRYGSSINMGDPLATTGIAGTVAMFMKHPVIGVGMVAVFDEFIGDTQYISLLHNGGIILFSVTLLFYISLYMKQRKAKELPKMMMLSALMFASLAINALTVTNFIPFIALCIETKDEGTRTDDYSNYNMTGKRYGVKTGGSYYIGKKKQEI